MEKANVRTEGDKTILRSYSTDVAYIKNGVAVVNGTYSNTTLRHIKEFLRQNDFKANTSSQILEDYKESEEDQKINKKEEKDKVNSMMKSVSMLASLGDLFCDKKKDKNDWKLRMLKAGLENKGLMIPEDWETLTEQEKETRLNKVIEVARENK